MKTSIVTLHLKQLLFCQNNSIHLSLFKIIHFFYSLSFYFNKYILKLISCGIQDSSAVKFKCLEPNQTKYGRLLRQKEEQIVRHFSRNKHWQVKSVCVCIFFMLLQLLYIQNYIYSYTFSAVHFKIVFWQLSLKKQIISIQILLKK